MPEFGCGLGYEHSKEIVAVAQSHCNSRCYGIDILQYAGILHPVNVGG